MHLDNAGLSAWSAMVSTDRQGLWHYRVEGWSDPYGTWEHDATIKVEAGIDVECDRTVYYETGTPIGLSGSADAAPIVVDDLPEKRQHLLVRTGDEIRLQRDLTPTPATRTGPHRIGCELGDAFDDVEAGPRGDGEEGEHLAAARRRDEELLGVGQAGVAPEGSVAARVRRHRRHRQLVLAGVVVVADARRARPGEGRGEGVVAHRAPP